MDLQHRAMLMLDKRRAVPDTARRTPQLLRDHDIYSAVIGSFAVVLHGHIRTTH